MQKRLIPVFISLLLGALASSTVAYAATVSFTSSMQAAAQARGVPLPLVEAIAYVNARWEPIGGPVGNGGFGPMNMRPEQMAQASALSGHTANQIKGDSAANLDAGAALLAHLHQGSAADLASWRPAVSTMLSDPVAAQVFDALQGGVTGTTTGGEKITLPARSLPKLPAARAATSAAPAVASTDYPPAAWVPASTANYSVSNRPQNYPVDMVVIHDIEGSYGSAISQFQNPAAQDSAHYVVSDAGQITQMVLEKDIAWHAGNWDYNTRAIGIEHEGFATGRNWYTPTMYQASAQLTASICSRWGVHIDRSHIIGHYQVPDPNNPGQFGGAGHHTDPGTNWDWNYYMNTAVSYALQLPSPPHMATDPDVVEGDRTVWVSWQPAKSCHNSIDSYTVVSQPGNITQTLPGNATGATFTGLTNGTSYTFTVTAHNSEAADSLTSSAITPGKPWATRENVWSMVGSGPAVASWTPNRLDTFFRGTDGHLYHEWSIGGSPWSSPELLGGILTSAPAAVAWAPDRIDVFVRGADSQLWHIYWGGKAWSGWEPLGGILSTAPSVAAWSVNRLDIFTGGSDGQLWHKYWGGTGWGGWEPLGGTLTSSPTTAAFSTNRLDVFIRGSDYSLWQKSWLGTGWGGWVFLGGSLGSAPAVSTWAAGRLDVFSVTDSGSLQHRSSTNGSTWNAWADIAGGRWVDDPTAIARQVGTIDLLGLTTDQGLWHVTYPTT